MPQGLDQLGCFKKNIAKSNSVKYEIAGMEKKKRGGGKITIPVPIGLQYRNPRAYI